jgi:ABC-type amino acid transport substrate-binding protein
MKRCALLALLLAGLSGMGTAHAAKDPLVLAFFAPTAPLQSAAARFAYVEKLAQQLQAAGVPVEGRAFARAADLDAALRRGQVDLAVLDAIYLAERGVNFPVLAVATVGADTSVRWGLYTSAQAASMLDLQGQKLAWAQAGSREPAFLDNVLLDGELQVAQFFELRPPAPDVAAAVSEVVLRRADCVFAPEPATQGKGLRRVYDAGRVPNPALVQVRKDLPRELVALVQRTVVATATLGGLDGWRPSGAEPFQKLRQRFTGRGGLRRLVLAEPQSLHLLLRSEMLVREEAQPVLLPLRRLIAAPPDIP